MRKRVLSLCIAFCMLLTLLPISVSADKSLTADDTAMSESADASASQEGADNLSGLNCHEMTELWFGNTETANLMGNMKITTPKNTVLAYFDWRMMDYPGVSLMSPTEEPMCSNIVIKTRQLHTAAVEEYQKTRNIMITDAETTVQIDKESVTYHEDGTVTLYAYEWVFFDYDDLHDGVGGSDVSGYGTWHKFTLKPENGVFQIIADEYDESDLFGINTVADTPKEAENLVGEGESVFSDESATLQAAYSYNPSAAIAYADQWVYEGAKQGVYKNYEEYYNPAYRNFNPDGGDCANYVSQCLSAGGLPQISGSGGWYYTNYSSWSASWVGANNLRDWMASHYGTKVSVNSSNCAQVLSAGNPIFFQSGHAGICVGKNSAGEPILNAHNYDRYHVKWDSQYVTTVQISPGVDPFTRDTRYPVPITAYPAQTSGKVTVYNDSLNAYSTSSRWIDYNDKCSISAVYTNGFCRVTYPSGSSTASAYAKWSSFNSNAVTPYAWSPLSNVTSYKRSNMGEEIGEVYATDSCTVVGASGDVLQVIYPVSGGYKIGWVKDSAPIRTAHLDVNAYLDGNYSGDLAAYGTFDVHINGALVQSGANDYYVEHPIGTQYEITNIKAADGYLYSGLRDGSLSGTVQSDPTNVVLAFDRNTPPANNDLLDMVIYNAEFYRAKHSDLSNMSDEDLQSHWLNYGLSEGRQGSQCFSASWYTGGVYPDLAEAFKNDYEGAVAHFLRYGIPEGRAGSENFNLNCYKANYGDLQKAFGDNNYQYAAHYIVYGWNEGRVANRRMVVKFDANGGSCGTAEQPFTQHLPYGTLPVPSRPGYAFDGWQTDDGTPVSSDTIALYDDDHTLHAQWTQTDTESPTITKVEISNLSTKGYRVSIGATDNVGVVRVRMPSWVGDYNDKVPWPDGVKVGSEWRLDVVRDGEKETWHTDVRAYDSAGNQAPLISIYINYLTVAFDTNGGFCAKSAQELFCVRYRTDYQNPVYPFQYGDLPTPTRDGYTFDGWYTAVNGGGLITAESKVTATENHTLYAHWTKIPEERNLTSIEINSRPNKTTYDVGEAFDSAGLSIKATYSNGDSEILTSGFSISDFDSSSAGTKDITVTYHEKTASFSIVVKEIDKPQIVVGNGNASRGMTIDIPVTIQSNPGIAGAMLAISYDKSALTLNKIAQGPLFEHGSYSAPSEIGIVQWYHTEDVKEDGVLFILQFTVNETAQNGNYNISVELRDDVAANLSNADSKIVDAQFISGVLEITSGIRGDVTGDGVVAINDVVKVARAVAGSLTLTESEKALADVTGDGVIAINDVVKLARYVAGSVATLQSAEAVSLLGSESAVIEVGTVSGVPGETIQVPVFVISNPGIAGAQLDISFDEGLTLKNIAKGDVLSAGTFNPDVDNGRIQWYYDQANVTNIGVLFTLEFEISANANNGDAYAVTVNVKDGITANLSDYDFNPVNAEFKAGKVQAGDTSGNAVISTVSRNGNMVTASVVCGDSNASVFCGVYNNSGKMIAVRSVQITSESTYQFQFDGQKFDYAKVFILDSNFCPLCESKRS